MILSPSVLGIFHRHLVEDQLAIITDIALGIIAFSIGGSLDLLKVRKLGKLIFWITIFQGTGAFLLVTGAIVVSRSLLFGHSQFLPSHFLAMALVVGALSAATAPAATLSIIREYRAKGPMTTILLGVVTLDDALTILFFSFSIAVAGGLMAQSPLSAADILLGPTKEIVIALMAGGAMGVFLKLMAPVITRRSAMLGVVLGAIFLTGGLAATFHSSALLANMILGFFVVNFVRQSEDLFTVIDGVEESIFAMFFVLAGAHLDLGTMSTAGWLAGFIVIGRFSGKFFGARMGAWISGAPVTVRKYLGFGLLPKAGVTVGLVLMARELMGASELTDLMVNAVLASVIINELMSPLLVRYAIVKSGEANVNQDVA